MDKCAPASALLNALRVRPSARQTLGPMGAPWPRHVGVTLKPALEPTHLTDAPSHPLQCAWMGTWFVPTAWMTAAVTWDSLAILAETIVLHLLCHPQICKFLKEDIIGQLHCYTNQRLPLLLLHFSFTNTTLCVIFVFRTFKIPLSFRMISISSCGPPPLQTILNTNYFLEF